MCCECSNHDPSSDTVILKPIDKVYHKFISICQYYFMGFDSGVAVGKRHLTGVIMKGGSQE